MPPPTMATLNAFGLEDSVVEGLMVEAAVLAMEVEVVWEVKVACVEVKDERGTWLIDEYLLVLWFLKLWFLQKEGKEAVRAVHIYTNWWAGYPRTVPSMLRRHRAPFLPACRPGSENYWIGLDRQSGRLRRKQEIKSDI